MKKNDKINYIKLSGKINNKEKNIVIYYDNLKNINDKDINNHLSGILQTHVDYNDFFLEIDKDDNINKDDNELYFSKLKLYFKNNKDIKLHWNNVLSNNFIIKSIIFKIYNNLIFTTNMVLNLNNSSIINGKNYELSLFNKFLNSINEIKDDINIFTNILNDINIYSDTSDKIQTYTINFINKIKNRYINKNIFFNKYIIIINHYIHIINKNVDYIINKINKYIKKYDDNLIYKINIYPFYDNLPQLIFKLIIKLTKIYKIFNIINDIFNDIYTMRRILDKDYISNCIIYSKSNILTNYVFSLVKLFKFKIIDISTHEIGDINNKINNIKFDVKYQYNTSKLLNFS